MRRAWRNAVALGGRYDEVERRSERARPATGFSMDLRDLARTAPHEAEAAAIRAPHSNDAGSPRDPQAANRRGVVVVGLPGQRRRGVQPTATRAVKRTGKWTCANWARAETVARTS